MRKESKKNFQTVFPPKFVLATLQSTIADFLLSAPFLDFTPLLLGFNCQQRPYYKQTSSIIRVIKKNRAGSFDTNRQQRKQQEKKIPSNTQSREAKQ